MKKISMIITLLLAFLVLGAGIAGLPAVYSVFFDPEAAVEEDLPQTKEAEEEADRFMKSLQYPLWEESEPLTREEISLFGESAGDNVNSMVSFPGQGMYQRLFELVGKEADDSLWDKLSRRKGGGGYILHTAFEEDGREYFLAAAFDGNEIPFLVLCQNTREPSGEEVREAAAALQALAADPGDTLLQDYLEKIDAVYERCDSHWIHRVRLYLSIQPESERMQELPERIPLGRCCEQGDWQASMSNGKGVLVCVMGQGSLVLYYDAAEGCFCGYRLLLGEAEFINY